MRSIAVQCTFLQRIVAAGVLCLLKSMCLQPSRAYPSPCQQPLCLWSWVWRITVERKGRICYATKMLNSIHCQEFLWLGFVTLCCHCTQDCVFLVLGSNAILVILLHGIPGGSFSGSSHHHSLISFVDVLRDRVYIMEGFVWHLSMRGLLYSKHKK